MSDLATISWSITAVAFVVAVFAHFATKEKPNTK